MGGGGVVTTCATIPSSQQGAPSEEPIYLCSTVPSPSVPMVDCREPPPILLYNWKSSQ